MPPSVVSDKAPDEGTVRAEVAKASGVNAMDILRREERKKEVLAFRAALEESIPLELASSVPLPKSRSQFTDSAAGEAPAIPTEDPPMEWFFHKPREGWRHDALDPSYGLPQAQTSKPGAKPTVHAARPSAAHDDDEDEDGKAEAAWASRPSQKVPGAARSRPPSAPSPYVAAERSTRTSQQALAALSNVELQVGCVAHACRVGFCCG